jgi:hypothetical protein
MSVDQRKKDLCKSILASREWWAVLINCVAGLSHWWGILVSILLADEGVSGMLGKIECFATAFFRILKTFDSYTDVQDDVNSSKVQDQKMV